MKKRMVLVVLGIMCLAGCASQKMKQEEQKKGAIVISDEKADACKEEQSKAEEIQDAMAIDEGQAAMKDQIDFVYNDFLADYQDDLGRISIAESEASELIDRGDKLELKNAVVYRDYYLDADVVENAHAGDTIMIQKVPYHIDSMETSENGFYVDLTAEVDSDWEKGIYPYEDIYEFAASKDGKHYFVVYCSDDIIKEQLYTGSVFLAEDAIINAYVNDEIKDVSVSEYFATEEYPYIATWDFTLDEKGLISFIQNQLAG